MFAKSVLCLMCVAVAVAKPQLQFQQQPLQVRTVQQQPIQAQIISADSLPLQQLHTVQHVPVQTVGYQSLPVQTYTTGLSGLNNLNTVHSVQGLNTVQTVGGLNTLQTVGGLNTVQGLNTYNYQPVQQLSVAQVPSVQTVTLKPAVSQYRAQTPVFRTSTLSPIVRTAQPIVSTTAAPFAFQRTAAPQIQTIQRRVQQTVVPQLNTIHVQSQVPQYNTVQVQHQAVPQYNTVQVHHQAIPQVNTVQVQQRLTRPEQGVAILRQLQDVQADGSYNFAFETENGIVAQEEGRTINQGTNQESSIVQGSYSYTAPDGTPITVNYVADADGFRAEGAHLPKAPEIPEAIQRSLEYLRSLPPRPEDESGKYVPDANGY